MVFDRIREFFNDIFPGTVAGLTQTVVGYPLDTIKVKYINNTTKSIPECAASMYRDNGIRSFYQGVKSPLYGGLIYNTTIFYSYNAFDRLLDWKEDTKEEVFKKAFTIGSLVGTTTTVVECPMDLLKTQMQNDKSMTFKKALRIPAKSMFRGFNATLIRNIPSVGLYFGVFEYSQMYFEESKLLGSLVSGGLSGAACWGLTYPLDNIKTRIQSDNLNPDKRKYQNTLDCIRKTSFKRMWSGFIPCMIRAVPVNAAIFFGYTYARQVIKFD